MEVESFRMGRTCSLEVDGNYFRSFIFSEKLDLALREIRTTALLFHYNFMLHN